MAKPRQGAVLIFFAVLCVTAGLTASASEGDMISQTARPFPTESPPSDSDPAEEPLQSLFSMSDELLTLRQVARKLPPAKSEATPHEAMMDFMDGIADCMKYATLPRRYVSVEVNKDEGRDWSLFSLRLSAEREEALREIATAVAQIDDLFHTVCPGSLMRRKGHVRSKNVLEYAEQLIRVGVHKAMLKAMYDPSTIGADEDFIPGLFNAARDVRIHPQRLKALEKLLRAPTLYQQKRDRLASVLESAVTKDIVFLTRLNEARGDNQRLMNVRISVSKRRSPVLGLIMRNKYPRIHQLVEEATDRAFDGLLLLPDPALNDDGTSSPGMRRGALRANETLPCHPQDFVKFGRFFGSGGTVYVWKYREAQSLDRVKPSEWAKLLAKMHQQYARDETELAKKIEMVRPLCWRKLKNAPFPPEQMVAVSTGPIRQFQKLVTEYSKANGIGVAGSEVAEADRVLPEGASKYMERSFRSQAVAVPRSWGGQLAKAGILKFLKNLGLAVLAIGAIGIGFFLTICAAGFMSGGVGSLVSCTAGAAIAGTAAVFVVSPGISLGMAGLVGISSIVLWQSRVQSGMTLALKNAKQTFYAQTYADFGSNVMQ